MSQEGHLGPAIPGYVLRACIGVGGFATVYRADHLRLRRTVAVKVLRMGLSTDQEVRWFHRECEVLGRLDLHPHVVEVLDADVTSDGIPYLAMRLYPGGTLQQLVERAGPLPADVAVGLVAKVAGALDAAHALGYVHRDVKPENVLLDGAGEPRLADFGIAAIVSSTTSRTGSSLFTLTHAAPEVIDHNAWGTASDTYALASTAYVLLAGRPPFTAESAAALMHRILTEPPPPIDRPDLPPGIEAVLQRGLAKDPLRRYPSCGAFAEALREAAGPAAPTAGDDPTTTPTAQADPPPAGTGRLTDLRSGLRTRRTVLVASAAGLTLLATLAGGTAALRRDAGAPEPGRTAASSSPASVRADFSRLPPVSTGTWYLHTPFELDAAEFPGQVRLLWGEILSAVGYQVLRDGTQVGVTERPGWVDRPGDRAQHTYLVVPLRLDGSRGLGGSAVRAAALAPPRMDGAQARLASRAPAEVVDASGCAPSQQHLLEETSAEVECPVAARAFLGQALDGLVVLNSYPNAPSLSGAMAWMNAYLEAADRPCTSPRAHQRWSPPGGRPGDLYCTYLSYRDGSAAAFMTWSYPDDLITVTLFARSRGMPRVQSTSRPDAADRPLFHTDLATLSRWWTGLDKRLARNGPPDAGSTLAS